MPDDQQAIRPIGIKEEPPAPGPPRLILAVALVAIGGLFGWGVATLGGDTIATASTTTTLQSDASPLSDRTIEPESHPTVTWTGATTVPPFPPNADYAGTTQPVELDGLIYLAVSFADRETGTISNELWSSSDGIDWMSTSIDLDEAVRITELTALRDGLLISGMGDGSFGMWRSVLGRTIGQDSWNRIPLDIPPDLVPEVHATTVNDDGEIITTIVGNIDIWREVVAPFVPSDIDFDGGARLDGGVLHTQAGGETVLFSETPEVLLANDTIWIRLLATNGDETLLTRDLPPGVYPVESSPELSSIQVAMAWRSVDGLGFLPTIGRSALPPGHFLPEAWGDGFIAAVSESATTDGREADTTLWETGSGRAWQPIEARPPQECSPFVAASSRDRLLLIAEDGTRCVGSEDLSWTVLPDPCSSCYAIGGPAGFLAYPDEFVYDTALYSHDGTNWVRTTIPAPEPYPTLSVLESRLFALSVNQPNARVPKHIDIWIGDIG